MVSPGKAPVSGRYRLAVLSRILATALGGYVVTALVTACLALGLPLIAPLSRGDTVLAATLPAFLILCGAVIWAFAARSAWRAWFGLLALGLLLVAVYGWLSGAWLPGAGR